MATLLYIYLLVLCIQTYIPELLVCKHYQACRDCLRHWSVMGDSSASYIYMVQHLIEKCLIFRMTKEECMEALSKHANITPVITSTVWKELEKENKEFFEAYAQSQSKEDQMSEAETSEMIQKMISDHEQSNDPKE